MARSSQISPLGLTGHLPLPSRSTATIMVAGGIGGPGTLDFALARYQLVAVGQPAAGIPAERDRARNQATEDKMVTVSIFWSTHRDGDLVHYPNQIGRATDLPDGVEMVYLPTLKAYGSSTHPLQHHRRPRPRGRGS